MLFRKDIEPRCEYCKHGTALGEGEIGCVKHGITSEGESCPKFRYDPLKREPERRGRDSKRFTQEDFEL